MFMPTVTRVSATVHPERTHADILVMTVQEFGVVDTWFDDPLFLHTRRTIGADGERGSPRLRAIGDRRNRYLRLGSV